MQNQCFEMLGIAMVICRNSEGKYLCVKESGNRGWWVPGGLVDPPENFFEAAIRETREEAGIDVELKGILRLEFDIEAKENFQRLKAIFYAEPKDKDQVPKKVKDGESDEAEWFSLKDIEELKNGTPGWRGPELYVWPKYIEDGGIITPLGVLDWEGNKVKVYTEDHVKVIKKN